MLCGKITTTGLEKCITKNAGNRHNVMLERHHQAENFEMN